MLINISLKKTSKMSNFDFKKYLAEGKLYEEGEPTPVEMEAQKLMDELGVMVAPDPQNGRDIMVYPNSKPDDRFYNSRSAQAFRLAVNNGQYKFNSAGGYRRSIQPIAQMFGLGINNNTGIAGRSGVESYSNPINISIDGIKKLVDIMQQGLKDESKAEADFYKGWSNPD
jgi:hypothetical protein